MKKNTRQENYERQTAELYQEIGRFIVTFEHLTHWMRSGIFSFMQAAVGFQNHQVAQTLISGQLSLLRARDLFRVFFSLANNSNLATPDGTELLKKVAKSCESLADERNIVVHSTWMVGYATEGADDFGTVTGISQKLKNTGVQFVGTDKTAAQFTALTERAKELIRQHHAITSCIHFNKPFTAYLKLDANGNVVTHGATFRAFGDI